MLAVRRIGLGAIALAAIAVFFLLAPDTPDNELAILLPDYADIVSDALSDFDANNARAEGAPQQQVVNGWVARDLLSIIALEQSELVDAARASQAEPDDRPAALLVLAIFGIAIWGVTSAPPVREPGHASAEHPEAELRQDEPAELAGGSAERPEGLEPPTS
jgi:hypothetical protein